MRKKVILKYRKQISISIGVIILVLGLVLLGISLYVTIKKQSAKDEQGSQIQAPVVNGEQEVVEGMDEKTETDSNEFKRNEFNSSEFEESFKYEETEVTSYIKEVFKDNADFALRLAECESTLGLNTDSPSGRYIGLFQFSVGTFNEWCRGDINDYRDQTLCAKELIDQGETGKWPNCP